MAKEDKLLRRGVEHHEAGRWQKAVECYQQVLRANPRQGDALYLLGVVAHSSGDDARAIESLRRALTSLPGDDRCQSLLGACLLRKGQKLRAAKQHREATDALAEAASLLPGDAGAHYELGASRQDAGRLDEAYAEYGKALEIDPKMPQAWYALGCGHSESGHYAAAAEYLRKALELAPAWMEARHNLGRALFELGQLDEAVDHFTEAARGPRPELPLAMIAVQIPNVPKASNQDVLAVRRAWAERTLPPAARAFEGGRRPSAIKDGRLSVGYVSAFFSRDNWMKPVWGLLNRHDRREFKIHLFSDAPASSIRHGYHAHPEDCFHDTSDLSNEALAGRIEQAGIDLLVDLNGYSTLRRLELFARRPAPVIIGWFNMFATTGMTCYDYLIGDAEVIPSAEEKFYCEKILRVPGSYLTFEFAYPVPEVNPAPAASGEAVTFGCLAPLYKITPQAVTAWSEILRRAPGSALILKNTAFRSKSNRDFVARMFGAHGIGEGRLRLEGPAEHYEFLETYGRIDVALDTFPYNGGTTTTEAIWQGVPVVTFWGDRWASRTSASILRAGGLERFVTRDLDEYVALAVELTATAESRQKLSELRAGMRAQLRASAVCATASFARNIEQLYRQACLPPAA